MVEDGDEREEMKRERNYAGNEKITTRIIEGRD